MLSSADPANANDIIVGAHQEVACQRLQGDQFAMHMADCTCGIWSRRTKR